MWKSGVWMCFYEGFCGGVGREDSEKFEFI